MSFRFKPAIGHDQQLVEFPRPVHVLRIQESWDGARFKVPLKDGDSLIGTSRNGVDIILQGQVGSVAGSLKLSEQEMFTTLESLRDALHVAADESKFQFFLYHDAASETYRYFAGCSTTRFEYDLSDPGLFNYSIVIHAEDPQLHTTL